MGLLQAPCGSLIPTQQVLQHPPVLQVLPSSTTSRAAIYTMYIFEEEEEEEEDENEGGGGQGESQSRVTALKPQH